MRERLSRLPAGALLVVRAQPAAAAMNFAELAGELDRVLGRVMSRNSRGRAA
jgi:ribonuclease P protein component